MEGVHRSITTLLNPPRKMALTSNFHFSEEKRHQTVGNSVRDRTSQARPLKRIVFHFLLKNSERNLKHGHAGG